MRKKEMTIPTILGITLILGGLVAGLWLLRQPLRGLVAASPEDTPQHVEITNLTDNSFVVSWTTTKATSGFIQYDADLVVADDRDQDRGSVGNYFTHLVTVKGLKSSTQYSFRLGSGKSLSPPYQVTTGVALRHPPLADVAYGQVVTADGDPAEGAIVYLKLPGVVPQATLVKPSGSWVVPLSTARTADLTSFAPYDRSRDKLELFVQGGFTGTATVLTTTADDSPVPTITLGKTYNYTPAAEEPQPEALPPTPSKFSATSLAGATQSPPFRALAITTPKSGEQVNSSRPQIVGLGPAGATVTIAIESPTKITDTVVVGTDGQWSYSVPQSLPPGEHTITVSALIDGARKKITKKFTVLAAGQSSLPAFTASPAATLKPRVVIPATASGVPQPGNLTPTLILAILGTGLILTGIFSYKKFS